VAAGFIDRLPIIWRAVRRLRESYAAARRSFPGPQDAPPKPPRQALSRPAKQKGRGSLRGPSLAHR